MMSATDWENETPYQVLGLDQGPQSTLEDIKKAYRYVFIAFTILKKPFNLPSAIRDALADTRRTSVSFCLRVLTFLPSLLYMTPYVYFLCRKLAVKLHPDKNRDDPHAADRFARLSAANEVLMDAEARAALDRFLTVRHDREARWSTQDAKRRKMREDLERKERQAADTRDAEDQAKVAFQREIQRLREQARKKQQERSALFAEPKPGVPVERGSGSAPEHDEQHQHQQQQGDERSLDEELSRTIKVSWQEAIKGGEGGKLKYEPEELRKIFSSFGAVQDVVMKAQKAKRQTARALVVFVSRAACVAACQSDRVHGSLNCPLLVVPYRREDLSRGTHHQEGELASPKEGPPRDQRNPTLFSRDTKKDETNSRRVPTPSPGYAKTRFIGGLTTGAPAKPLFAAGATTSTAGIPGGTRHKTNSFGSFPSFCVAVPTTDAPRIVEAPAEKGDLARAAERARLIAELEKDERE